MSEEKAAEAPAAAPAAPSSGGGGNKLVLILTLVNLLAVLGMGAVVFISFQRDKKPASVEDIAAGGHGEGHGEAKKEGDHGGGGGGEHGGGGGHGGGAQKKMGDFGKMVALDQFTVNLATPGSVNPRFVRVNIAVEVPNGDVESEVSQKMPQIRNTIIDLFNSKRPGDLATGEGRDYLKEEIRNALNAFLVTGKVKGVFFTNIAVTS